MNEMYELEKLTGIMARRGMSHEAVARELGISYKTVGRWFSKKTKRPSQLARIAIKRFIKENE